MESVLVWIAVILFAISALIHALGNPSDRGVLLPLGLAFFAASFVVSLPT